MATKHGSTEQGLAQQQIEQFLNEQRDRHGLYLSLDIRGRPVAYIPPRLEGEEGVECEIRDGRTKAYLLRTMSTYFDLKKKPDIGSALAWMEVLAYEHGVADPSLGDEATLAETIDDDPMFVAVYEHTKHLKPGESTPPERATDDYNKLTKLASLHHHNMRGWPTRSSDLARQINNSQHIIRDVCGVFLTTKHTNVGSLWTWTREKPVDATAVPQTRAKMPTRAERQQKADADLFEETKALGEEIERKKHEADAKLPQPSDSGPEQKAEQ